MMVAEAPGYYCPLCHVPVSWEEVVTTEGGPNHEHGGRLHPVTLVTMTDVDSFFDDSLLWITILERFACGNDASGLLKELAETITPAELTRLQITASLSVATVMLHFIAGLMGTDVPAAVATVRGFMLDQLSEDTETP